VLLPTRTWEQVLKTSLEQSPADYLLYYKRATALLSLSRHAPALEDFDKVLSLTSNSFDNAHLMKARIHAKEGQFEDAHTSLETYLSRNKSPEPSVTELSADIVEGDKLSKKALQERQAQLWNACIETSSATLRIASHDIGMRVMRAECSLAAGDLDTATADLTRLSHLLPPSTELLSRIFRLQYFLLGISEAQTHLTPLKQCLHYDPDSKACLPLHRLAKGLDRGFTQLEDMLQKEDWRGAIKLLTTSGKNNDLFNRFEDALAANTNREQLLGSDSDPSIPLPKATHISPRRAILVHALCKAYVQSNLPRKAESWCEELLKMVGREDDLDGLIGRGEILIAKEEYEDAVRVLEKAFEASGRGSREVSQLFLLRHRFS
jgi:DnaJ homolog subfamily C member 3